MIRNDLSYACERYATLSTCAKCSVFPSVLCASGTNRIHVQTDYLTTRHIQQLQIHNYTQTRASDRSDLSFCGLLCSSYTASLLPRPGWWFVFFVSAHSFSHPSCNHIKCRPRSSIVRIFFKPVSETLPPLIPSSVILHTEFSNVIQIEMDGDIWLCNVCCEFVFSLSGYVGSFKRVVCTHDLCAQTCVTTPYIYFHPLTLELSIGVYFNRARHTQSRISLRYNRAYNNI